MSKSSSDFTVVTTTSLHRQNSMIGRSVDSDWRRIRVKADRITRPCCSKGTFFVIEMGPTPNALLKTRWLLGAQRNNADLLGNPMPTHHLAQVRHIYMGLSQGKAATQLSWGKAVTLPFYCLLMAAGIRAPSVPALFSLLCAREKEHLESKNTSKYLNTFLGWAVP